MWLPIRNKTCTLEQKTLPKFRTRLLSGILRRVFIRELLLTHYHQFVSGSHPLNDPPGERSMSLKLTSIADYLPRVLDVLQEEDCYGGFSSATDASHNLGKRRRAEETVQRSDAAKRRVIWVSARISFEHPRLQHDTECLWLHRTRTRQK